MEHETESGHADRPEGACTPEQPGAEATSEATPEKPPPADIPVSEASTNAESSVEAQTAPQEDVGTLLQHTAWMQDVEAFITEAPQGEDEDAFALIPAGPVEEVNYDEGRPRGPRARRPARGRRPERQRPARPAPVGAAPAPAPRRDRFPLWAVIAAAVILVLLGLLTLWIIAKYRSAAAADSGVPLSSPAVYSKMEESGHVV